MNDKNFCVVHYKSDSFDSFEKLRFTNDKNACLLIDAASVLENINLPSYIQKLCICMNPDLHGIRRHKDTVPLKEVQ